MEVLVLTNKENQGVRSRVRFYEGGKRRDFSGENSRCGYGPRPPERLTEGFGKASGEGELYKTFLTVNISKRTIKKRGKQ